MTRIAIFLLLVLLGTVTSGARARALISPGVGSAPGSSSVAGATLTNWRLDSTNSGQVKTATLMFTGPLAAGSFACLLRNNADTILVTAASRWAQATLSGPQKSR